MISEWPTVFSLCRPYSIYFRIVVLRFRLKRRKPQDEFYSRVCDEFQHKLAAAVSQDEPNQAEVPKSASPTSNIVPRQRAPWYGPEGIGKF